jgi:very-short-patch-repair endonuclease
MLSFDTHEKSKFWSSKNTLLPNQVALNSHKKFWFDCPNCGHCFEKKLKDINLVNGWCPYCANKNLCDQELNCQICYNKTFASHPKVIYWSSKNTETPYNVLLYSHKKYLFDCDKCNHEFNTSIYHITKNKSWCNFCSKVSPKNLCDKEKNCTVCFDRSFASIDKSKYWSSKNLKHPSEVFKSSGKKAWFTCEKCNCDFESKICHVTDGSWCPKCVYKTEDKLFNILQEYYPFIKTQYKVNWCKDKKHLPFDFVLEDKKIIIELDGPQHIKQIAKWKTLEHTKARDLYKMKCANDNGFSMIRILQNDVFKDKYDWLQELIANINKIIDENRVQNIYMCKNDEYKNFDII